ncbi:MAG: triose-phosphate isomerase [Clostridia bacterium]|nr:triose-phosphate isomerase [Clostridia bacterium]
MDRRYRKTIIAGNWKMNITPSEAKKLTTALLPLSAVKDTSIVLCVPAIDITTVKRTLRQTRIAVGGQNCHFESKGAFTGEISPEMLIDAGAKYVIIGHSERRSMFGDTDEIVRKKIASAIAAGLRPILCVGETEEQRKQGVTEEIIRVQIKSAVYGLSADDFRKIVVAYEPIWAIGTGNTATPEDANEVCKLIRTCLRELYGARPSRSISILYGGSMNEKNAKALLAMPHIDGGLIGGASLKPDAFAAIVEASKA